jgi:hypothetical protein
VSAVTAKQVETLNHALHGFKWLNENHEALVHSADVEVDGEVFSVRRDFNEYDEDGNAGVLVVDFE